MVVAVSGVEFGWGSAGKLDAVMAAVIARAGGPVRFVGLGSRLGRPVLANSGVSVWHDADPGDVSGVAEIVNRERVRVAVSVLDAARAKTLEKLGVPTVFVDSLPFLWTEGDLDWVPVDVTAYCAQRSVHGAERTMVLDRVRNLRWVGAVIPPGVSAAVGGVGSPAGPDRRPALPRQIVVNMGGLAAPGLADWRAYPRLVVPAVLRSAADLGIGSVLVRGNLPPDLAETLLAEVPSGLQVHIGPKTPAEFRAELIDSGLLVTSPGLTTLLEASALNRPTVCLPPQNVSQIFNARFFSRAVGGPVVRWPVDVLSESEVVAARSGGEETALALIYDAIRAAAADSAPVREALLRLLTDAVRASVDGGIDWTGLAKMVGTEGAAEVADQVLRLAAAG